jgi:opacity protein-like surface antigen
MEKTVNRAFSGLVAAAVFFGAAASAGAQGYNPFQIGASGGVAFPTGDLGNTTNTGYNVAVAVGYKSQLMPIGVRLEAAYNQFGLQGGGGSINVPAFTGNLTYELPLGMSFTPYAIGGVGLYRPSAGFNGGGSTQAENDFGWNIGGGIKIPLSSSFETFVEARYNSFNIGGGAANGGGTGSFIPVTVGVMF